MRLQGKNLGYIFDNGTEQVYDHCYISLLSGHYFSIPLFVISVSNVSFSGQDVPLTLFCTVYSTPNTFYKVNCCNNKGKR